MFGVKIRDKGNELMKNIEEENIVRLSEERHKLRKKARESVKKIEEENKKNCNKKRRKATSYEPGDLVAIDKTQFSLGSKLYPKYVGPYEVIMKKRNVRHAVRKIRNAEGSLMP
ncbi:hypothetical protein EVAR_55711_1 [Eumeta japonica]|uniref:Uncharacterized protein n=1 Tax=Eumeta variegata TaxID=151549 RepID=A0A4C1Z051_EUMVA|nr:hypothetical protein EVAR_55711_1 [Eumeta japonica]